MSRGPLAVRRLPVGVLALAMVVALGLAILCNAYLFRSPALLAVVDATSGWLSGTLLANALLLLVVVHGLLVRVGGALAADLGLRRADVVPAIAATVALWLVLNAAQAAVSLATGEAVTVSRWFVEHWTGRAAELIGQLFGNALFEEVMFRAVLLGQLAVWMAPEGMRPGRREVLLATGWSQVWFSLQHVPNRLAFTAWDGFGSALGDLALLWFSGVCFAAVWLRTGNLLVAVGYHALGNCPFLVLAGPDWVHPVAMFVALLGIVALGPRWGRLQSGRETDAPGRTPSA